MGITKIDLKVEFIPVLKILTIPFLGRFLWSTNFVQCIVNIMGRFSINPFFTSFFVGKSWQMRPHTMYFSLNSRPQNQQVLVGWDDGSIFSFILVAGSLGRYVKGHTLLTEQQSCKNVWRCNEPKIQGGSFFWISRVAQMCEKLKSAGFLAWVICERQYLAYYRKKILQKCMKM